MSGYRGFRRPRARSRSEEGEISGYNIFILFADGRSSGIRLVNRSVYTDCLAQLWSTNLSWRVGVWVPMGIAVGAFVSILFFYRPPPRVNSVDLNKRQILARIDYLGGILSIMGITLFLTGLQLGGYNWYF